MGVKKMEFRLLETGFNDAFTNMAVDEAINQLHKETDKPVVRFYGWKPNAISIGYFQSMKEEVELEECKKEGVDLVRRITGGGAVFHQNELTYSFVCSEQSNLVSKNILDSYKKICNSLVLGFKELELTAEFVPLNDIVVNNQKISGNAQTRRNNNVLQHGTILIEVDVDKMFSLLLVPDEKMKGKLVENIKQRVTSINNQLERKVEFNEVSKAMKQGFEENFNAELVKGELTEKELSLAEEIKKEKFSSHEWNFKR
ncbi:MAG: biotin/lipoate A/B protein ligase family protein [Candidatus Diapherotrites archaeon]